TANIATGSSRYFATMRPSIALRTYCVACSRGADNRDIGNTGFGAGSDGIRWATGSISVASASPNIQSSSRGRAFRVTWPMRSFTAVDSIAIDERKTLQTMDQLNAPLFSRASTPDGAPLAG